MECGIFLQGVDADTQELFAVRPNAFPTRLPQVRKHAWPTHTDLPPQGNIRVRPDMRHTAYGCTAREGFPTENFGEIRLKTLHCHTNRHIARKGFLRLCLAKLLPWLNGSQRECVTRPTSMLPNNPGFGSAHGSRFLLKNNLPTVRSRNKRFPTFSRSTDAPADKHRTPGTMPQTPSYLTLLTAGAIMIQYSHIPVRLQ